MIASAEPPGQRGGPIVKNFGRDNPLTNLKIYTPGGLTTPRFSGLICASNNVFRSSREGNAEEDSGIAEPKGRVQ